MKIRLVSAFWGRGFVDTFLRVALRSLLAEGNAPDLAQRHEVLFQIHTTHDCALILEASPVFNLLRSRVNVRVDVFAESDIDASNYGSHGIFWERALEVTTRTGEILFFIIPDIVYACGTLLRWAKRFEDGARALYTPGPQVVLETVLPRLEERFSVPGSPIAVTDEQVNETVLRDLHPWHATMWRSSEYKPHHPEVDLRIVEGRGFTWREIAAHPHCIDGSFFLGVKQLNPIDHLDRLAFEACSIMSLEPLLKRASRHYRKWRRGDLHLSNLGNWCHAWGGPALHKLSRHTFEFRKIDDATWREGRRAAVRASDFYHSQLLMAARIYEMFIALRDKKLHRAASWLAAAHYCARLRRVLPVRGKVIILAPVDSAFGAREDAFLLPLLEPGKERELATVLRQHMLLEPETSKPEVHKEALLARVKIQGEAFELGPFVIYPVDRVLTTMDLPEPQAGPSAAKGAERITAQTYHGTTVTTAWAKRSRINRLLYWMLHVPFLELVVSPIYLRKDLPHLAARVLHRAAHLALRILGPVPGLGHMARVGFFGVRYLTAFGWRKTAVRIFERADRKLVRIPLIGHAAFHTHVFFRYAESFGFRAAGAKAVIHARSMLRNRLRGAAWRPIPTALDDFRHGRSLISAADVLTSFYAVLSPSGPMPSAAVLADDVLAKSGAISSGSNAIDARALSTLLATYSNSSEVWLEAGFMHEDQNRPAEAIDAYRRAMGTLPCFDGKPGSPDPRRLAQAHVVRLLVRLGRDNDAIALIEDFVAMPAQGLLAAECGMLLRRHRKYALALEHFGRGMELEEPFWNVPSTPRDFRTLQMTSFSRHGKDDSPNEESQLRAA